jgi:Kef-type K+ transport system membrane component KefB/mannitol/fructose-specific phosphotransferase system IIA component (Ntr-type)
MMNYINEQNIFIFLVQIFLLLGLARGLGETFRKWNLPSFTGEILVGIFLGPTIFGRYLPWLYQFVFPADIIQHNMLETVAWLGIMFLLLETGLEMDFSSAIRQSRDALKIALADIIVPISLSFTACLLLPDHYLVDPSQRILFSLFMATVMTISAMAITARALHDLNISKTDLGFLILSALSINDIIGWLIFTVVLGLFMQTRIDFLGIAIIATSTIGFTFLCLTFGRKLVDRAISEIKIKKDEQPTTALTFICLLGLFCGAIAQKIGIYALFGFFLAGIMAGSAKALTQRTRHVISQMVHAIFVPLFFASIGLNIDIFKHFDLFLIVFVTLMSLTGKFLGAWIGTGFTKISRANRLPIAIAHTSGGIMEVVIGLLALKYNLITESIFIALVFGAMTSSVLLGPCLSYAIKKRKEIGVLEFFSNHGIIAELSAAERDSAIWELCNLASDQETSLDARDIYQKVIDRETAMGTGIEEGIAVPHARLPFLKKPFIFFGRSTSGIEWNSPDGKYARFIFLIFTPEQEDDIQVQILSSIAKTMYSKHIRHEIISAKDKHELWLALNRNFTSQMIARK